MELQEVIKRTEKFVAYADSAGLVLSPFELKPGEFLSYAEIDLEKRNTEHDLVNVLGNVKRAIECEVDSLLYIFGLSKISKK